MAERAARVARANRKDDPGRERFIEDFALWADTSGQFPRMAARVLAYLMVCERPAVTQAELSENLLASAGSVSTSLKLLIERGFVERTFVRGSRGLAYRPRAGVWELDQIRRGEEVIHSAIGLLQRGIDMARANRYETKWLEAALQWYRFTDEEMRGRIERWPAWKASARRRAAATRRSKSG